MLLRQQHNALLSVSSVQSFPGHEGNRDDVSRLGSPSESRGSQKGFHLNPTLSLIEPNNLYKGCVPERLRPPVAVYVATIYARASMIGLLERADQKKITLCGGIWSQSANCQSTLDVCGEQTSRTCISQPNSYHSREDK